MTNSLQDVLQNSLSGIINQAKQHLMIDQLFKAYLEKDLHMHCQVAQLQENKLIIHVSSGVWLTRINCEIPKLLSMLKIHPLLANLEKIQCKVRPFNDC